MMSTPANTITIQLTSDDVDAIQQLGDDIVVVGTQQAAAGDCLVVCATFQPALGPTTTISFGADWAVFADSTPLDAAGKPAAFPVLDLKVQQAAEASNTYPFDGTGFDTAVPAYPDDAFGLANQTDNPLDFGLALKITTNADFNNGTPGWQPLVVMPAPAGQTSYLQPATTVYVLLATGMQAGMVLPAGMVQPVDELARRLAVAMSNSNYVAVDFTANPTLYFDSDQNCFTVTPPSAA